MNYMSGRVHNCGFSQTVVLHDFCVHWSVA